MLKRLSRRATCSLLLISLPALAEEPAPAAASYRSTVTAAELETWLELNRGRAPVDRESALRDLILARSLAEEALRLGLDRQPEAQLQIELKDVKLMTTALRRAINQSIEITDEQAEAKYQQIKDTYTQPRRVRLYNLYKRYPLDATDGDKQAVLAEMEQLRKRLLAGEDFGELAQKESDSQTRFQKGLLGNVPAGTFPPQIDEIVMAMQPGDISEIFYGTEGLTLFYCEKILDKVYRSPENLRKIARNLLEKRAYKNAWAELQESLASAAAPTFHWQVLDAEPTDPDATLVEYSGGRLTLADVEGLLRSGRRPTEPSQLPRRQLSQRIEKFLLSRMRLKEAERRGLDKDHELAARRALARLQVLADRARVHLVEGQFDAPEEDAIREYYETHRDDFTRPTFYDLAAIRLPLEGEELPIYRQGERIVHRIRNGEISFGDAAREFSQNPTAKDGGELGPISRWVVPHAFGFNGLRAILALETGEVSDLVAEGDSLWIFRLNGVEESRPMTWDEARESAENKLGTRLARALEVQLIDAWMDGLQIEITP